MAGMQAFLRAGVFEAKAVPRARVASLAAAYVGYIVLCNLNLNLNPVGFYQISKIVVAPTVLAIEFFAYGKRASRGVVAAVAVVCGGVGLATVTDPEISSNAVGLAVGAGSVAATALYQIWAGAKQKELGLGSMQLLHQYVPIAAALLGALVLLCEPLGWAAPTKDTLLGFPYGFASGAAILVSACLGLAVNLSTFLVIGATSSLTYNIVGHVKTVIILAGGVVFFGDTMPPKKLAGIAIAMGGIVWYSQIKLAEAREAAAAGKGPLGSKTSGLPPPGALDAALGGLGGRAADSGSSSPKLRRPVSNLSNQQFS
jgi:solute carrier family 35 protein E3